MGQAENWAMRWMGHGKPGWMGDLLTIIATQGFGLAIGCIIYATFVGVQLVYYWAIPGVALGVVAVFFAVRLSGPRPKSSVPS